MPDEQPRIFGSPEDWPDDDLIGLTDGGLVPEVVLAAYGEGVFPMPHGRSAFARGRKLVGWYSPDPRGVLPLDGLRVPRSLRKTSQRYEIRVDTAFSEVLDGCADRSRPHGWIDRTIRAVYTELHEAGIVHSVEAWTRPGVGDDGTEVGARLAGGLYGVSLGGLFAGESMFHRPDIGRDASKAALIGLVGLLTAAGPEGRLLDVQWRTEHLDSLGVVEVSREKYLERLQVALTLPPPDWSPTARS